jgi:hypothetical protein
MQEINTETWEDFEKAISDVRAQYGTFRFELDNGVLYERENNILFRGQANSKWPLATTLERKAKERFDIQSYVWLALTAHNELESYTGKKWEVPSHKELEEQIARTNEVFTAHLPAYEFLVYLRHHGFPSPLLDWTESPYIAAFFAYHESNEADPAVYCYIERPNSTKGGVGGAPFISVQGPYISTHQRHFAQKAWYTIATKWNYQNEKHYFCTHDSIFSQNSSQQDVLVKINLPAKGRIAALKKLSDYNINHFTLFQSEDALVKAIEYKYFDLRQK